MKKDERKALAFIGSVTLSITILIIYFALKYGMR